jgi:hypothetical protein
MPKVPLYATIADPNVGEAAGGATPSGTGFVHVTAGAQDEAAKLVETADVSDDQITNAKLAEMVEATVKGRAAGAGTGNPSDLTAAQVLTLLGAFAGVPIQVFTATGANTYTPTAGMKYCIVISTGAGGGGGGAVVSGGVDTWVAAGAGGGAGGTCIEAFSAATIGASQTVTIGTGGTAGASSGGNGGNGGNTTFGALHTANGGSGGAGLSGTTAAAATAGGAGGTGSGGTMNITGGDGGAGVAGGVDGTTDLCLGISGHGGGSLWGGGARSVSGATATISGDVTVAGVAGAAYGSGGSGAVALTTTTGGAGGAGANGVCLVIEFT